MVVREMKAAIVQKSRKKLWFLMLMVCHKRIKNK